MKFKETNRTHQVGKGKSKPILVPDIKFKEDIPKKVNEIQETFNNFREKLFNFCDKICRDLGHKIGLHFLKIVELIIKIWNTMLKILIVSMKKMKKINPMILKK